MVNQILGLCILCCIEAQIPMEELSEGTRIY